MLGGECYAYSLHREEVEYQISGIFPPITKDELDWNKIEKIGSLLYSLSLFSSL